jgi:putative DNA primase/helicase
MTIYLDVPYAEKAYAKERGAKWDDKKKLWYVPEGVSALRFERWWRTKRNGPRPPLIRGGVDR